VASGTRTSSFSPCARPERSRTAQGAFAHQLQSGGGAVGGGVDVDQRLLSGPRDDGCSHVEIDAAFERPGQQPRQMRVGFRLRDQPPAVRAAADRLSRFPSPLGELLQQRADRRGEPLDADRRGRTRLGRPGIGRGDPAIGTGPPRAPWGCRGVSREPAPPPRPPRGRRRTERRSCSAAESAAPWGVYTASTRHDGPSPWRRPARTEGSSVHRQDPGRGPGVARRSLSPGGRGQPLAARANSSSAARKRRPQVFPPVPWRGARSPPSSGGRAPRAPGASPARGDSRLRLPVASIRTRL